MNLKTEFSSAIENEIINLVVKSPSILNRIRRIIQNDCQAEVSHNKPSSAISLEMAEEQMGKLMVQYENDSTIVVKAFKKPPIPYDCRQLGFRDNRAKGWRFLINVLEIPPHTFNFGTAYTYPDGSRRNRVKNKAYDAGWKVCDDLCKKLIRFFHKEFGMEFPRSFKLYEKLRTNHPGDRRFKFQIGSPSFESDDRVEDASFWKNEGERFKARCKEFGEPQLKKEIVNLNRDYSSDSKVHNTDPDHLVHAFKVGREKYGWNDQFIRELLLE